MAKITSTPNRAILEAALQGLEAQREKVEEQINQVRGLLGGRSTTRSTKTTSAASAAPAKKRTLSAEARKRIAAASWIR